MGNKTISEVADLLGISVATAKYLAERKNWGHQHYENKGKTGCPQDGSPCWSWRHVRFSDSDIKAIQQQHGSVIVNAVLAAAPPFSSIRLRKTRSDAGIPRKNK